MYMLLFTCYSLSSADHPEGPCCPRRDSHTTGSPTVPPPLTSEFVGMASYAPTYFLDLMDDDVESDGSSIDDVAPSHCLSWECAMADAPG